MGRHPRSCATRQVCVSLGGHLASLHSEEEHMVYRELLHKRTYYQGAT